MAERLLHFSAERLTELRADWPYPSRLNGKPSGFWISVETGNDDGWADWCIAEEFGLDRLAYAHEVTLTEDARILRLSSAEHIDAFTARYAKSHDPELASLYTIDWGRVAREAVDEPGGYQGILIAPYVWSRRLSTHSFWYYGWDCASGCIWDLSAVASIRPVEDFVLQSANDSGMMVEQPTNGDHLDREHAHTHH